MGWYLNTNHSVKIVKLLVLLKRCHAKLNLIYMFKMPNIVNICLMVNDNGLYNKL